VRFSILAALASGALLLGNASTRAPARADDPTQQVMRTEIAFAKTMADRDYAAFGTFVSNEAVFFTSEQPLRGKEAVLDHWKRYYDKGPAPFSWAPERVEVLGSGTLALSTGPVRDPSGKLIGTFTSIWRQDAPGVWRIVFDKGNPVCKSEAQ
jgi:ketosteroid isomerase-like protein